MPKYIRKTKQLQNLLKVLVILCPFLVVSAFLFAFSPIAQAYSSYVLNGINSNTFLHCDNNSAYVISFIGNKLEIDYITDSNINKRTLKLQGEVKSVTTDNGIVYAISVTDTTLYLNRYIYNKDTLNSFIIEAANINSKYKFAVSNDRLYFAENDDYSQIACHSIMGEKLYSFYANMTTNYCTDNNGTLYICSENNIYTVDTTYNSQPQHKLSNISIKDDIFIYNNTIFDFGGNIINLQNGLITPTNIASSKLNGAIINGYYCKYSSGNIFGYTENGTANTLYTINTGENAQLCGFNGKLYILSNSKELFIINESELKFPQYSTIQPTANNSTPSNPSNLTPENNQDFNNNQGSHNNQDYSFSVNNYYIDKASNIIWNIPNSTTISTFKNNLTCSGYTLEFYDSHQVKKTSGKIGTGFSMVVKDNATEHSKYTMSVKGDLSGDGNINRTDVSLLSEYLMSSTTLTTEQYTSADTNADNIINGVDILKIARNNL